VGYEFFLIEGLIGLCSSCSIRLYSGIPKWVTKDGKNINTACIETSAPAMEAEGDSRVVAGSGAAAETAEGAMAEGADWVAEVGAEVGVDSEAAAKQGFRIQGSVV
jgi:hypothetical protein